MKLLEVPFSPKIFHEKAIIVRPPKLLNLLHKGTALEIEK